MRVVYVAFEGADGTKLRQVKGNGVFYDALLGIRCRVQLGYCIPLDGTLGGRTGSDYVAFTESEEHD
jgi:hypothetical protein